ncbi:MAG: glycosyltransferase [Desulfobacterales bacterium]|nr:glycosyltransferase [Desulfobacterales bacterium]
MRPANQFAADKVLAAVIARQGEDTIQPLLDTCLSKTGISVLLIDNASHDATCEKAHKANIENLECRALPTNIGVAAAANMALAAALERRSCWLWMLDQDSRCTPGCLARLLETAEALNRTDSPVGAVAACARSAKYPEHVHWPYRWNGVSFEEPADIGEALVQQTPWKVDSSLSSGTLYAVEALNRVGGFRSDYFIDFVEHELHLRLRDAGYSFYWDPGAVIYHQLGQYQKLTPQGLWLEHAPERYYYMARNMMDGLYRAGGRPARRHFLRHTLPGHIFLQFRWGRHPIRATAYALKGLYHAWRKEFKPLPASIRKKNIGR